MGLMMSIHSIASHRASRKIKQNKVKTLQKCSEANGSATKSGIRAPNQPFQTPASRRAL